MSLLLLFRTHSYIAPVTPPTESGGGSGYSSRFRYESKDNLQNKIVIKKRKRKRKAKKQEEKPIADNVTNLVTELSKFKDPEWYLKAELLIQKYEEPEPEPEPELKYDPNALIALQSPPVLGISAPLGPLPQEQLTKPINSKIEPDAEMLEMLGYIDPDFSQNDEQLSFAMAISEQTPEGGNPLILKTK